VVQELRDARETGRCDPTDDLKSRERFKNFAMQGSRSVLSY